MCNLIGEVGGRGGVGGGGGGGVGDLWSYIQVGYISVCMCKFLFSVDSSWWRILINPYIKYIICLVSLFG